MQNRISNFENSAFENELDIAEGCSAVVDF